jgi:hypothetical protein
MLTRSKSVVTVIAGIFFSIDHDVVLRLMELSPIFYHFMSKPVP